MNRSGHQRSQARRPASRREPRNTHHIPPRLADLQLDMVATLTNFFLFLMLIFLSYSFYLQVINQSFIKKLTKQRTAVLRHQATRGNIFDRNSQILAQNIKTYKILLDPHQLDDVIINHLIAELPTIFPKIDLAKVEPRLRNKSRREALIWRHASYDQLKAFKKLTNKFVGVTETTKRIYPKGALAGPFLGFVSLVKDHLNSAGRAGIEHAYDWALSGEDIIYESQRNGLNEVAPVSGALHNRSSDGRSIMTTIDMRLQQITEAYLGEQVEEMGAKQGIAVVMDPHTGDILAVAQVPSYDPNKYNKFKGNHQNLFISSQTEPGSTMKPFLVSAALNEKVVSTNTRFQGMGGQFKLGRFTIKDSHTVEDMTTLEIIKFSSNVGAIQLAQMLGKNAFYSYLKSFGFGELTQIRLYGEVSGKVHQLKNWNPVNLGTMSYGYGISVTPIQMVQALSAIANGGELIAPRVVKATTNELGEIEEEFPVRVVRRVISERVAKLVTRGMEMVTANGGTGIKARVNGYRVAGKTGTAHKADSGGYSNKKVVASFMGFVPSKKPRLAIYISIDEPEKEQYGGKVAAPVFAKIVSEALPFMGVPPDDSIVARPRRSRNRAQRTKRNQTINLIKTLDNTPWWSKDRFLTRASEDMVVPDIKGLDLKTALEKLKLYDLDVKVKGSGVIVSQSPESGELLPSHDLIEVTLKRPTLLRRPASGAELIQDERLEGEQL
jgi:cell division protein FtsI (penicillin-binding protein 3)